jgi:hypothetical protein
MTMTTSGKIDRQPPQYRGLRDLSDQRVRDQIVSEAREDANATLLRNRRKADRAKQAGQEK